MNERRKAQQEAKNARSGALFFTIAALIMTIVVAWLLAKVLSTHVSTERAKQVVVAQADLPAFTKIRKKHVRVSMWPEASVPESAFESLNELFEEERITRLAIDEGMPLLKTRLGRSDEGLGVEQLIEEGMRAVAVEVSNALATSRLLSPGVYVDVIATIDDPDTQNAVSRIVLQRRKVLAVGREFDATRSSDLRRSRRSRTAERDAQTRARVVTLLVEPHEAEAISLIASEGEITLAMRGAKDDLPALAPGIDQQKLLGKKRVAPKSIHSGPKIISPKSRGRKPTIR
jgi:pilus assembly protein CpaB